MAKVYCVRCGKFLGEYPAIDGRQYIPTLCKECDRILTDKIEQRTGKSIKEILKIKIEEVKPENG